MPPHGEAELRQPEPNYYAIGMKSYGRAPSFLLATGYEQARSVAAALAGDWIAARDVQLHLPETGVCVTDYEMDGCCGRRGGVLRGGVGVAGCDCPALGRVIAKSIRVSQIVMMPDL